MKTQNIRKVSDRWQIGCLSLLCLGLVTNGITLGQQIVSDDFNRSSLNQTLWTTVDPVGDGTFAIVGFGSTNVVHG